MKYRLERHESLHHGLQRVIPGLLQGASHAAARTDIDAAHRVHLVRKRLKRARSIHKLGRPALDAAMFGRDQAWMRDRGRRLSAVRDSDVLWATLERLKQRIPHDSHGEWAVESLRSSLARLARRLQLEMPASRLLDDMALELAGKAGEWNVEPWTAPRGNLVRHALDRGVERYLAALGAVERFPGAERMHTLRKRVKDLGYQMEFVAGRSPNSGKRLTRRADRLGQMLGRHHDAWVFAEKVAQLEELSDAVRAAWLELADAESKRLALRAISRAGDLRRALAREAAGH